MTTRRIFLLILLVAISTGCSRKTRVSDVQLSLLEGEGVENPGGTTPPPGGTTGGSGGTTPPPPLLFPKVGENAANCMSNPKYTACGFEIDPMFQKRTPLTPALQFTTDATALQIFGFELTGLDNSGFLKNAFIDVMSDPTRAAARAAKTPAGDFKFAYSNCNGGVCTKDPEQKACQVQMYHGLQKQIEFMENNVFKGSYYPGAKGILIRVYAYANAGADSGQTNNAYANGNSIHMLEVQFGNGANHTNGCDYGIAAHEMCHNVFFAAEKDAGTTSPFYGQFHEGQGDACGFMVTGQPASAAHAWFNSLDGLPGRKITNNLAIQLDQAGTAEVHNGGRPIAAIYYLLRTTNGAVAKEIDQIWFTALSMISTNDTFVGIGRAFLAADKLLFNAGQGKYQAQITARFAERGVTL